MESEHLWQKKLINVARKRKLGEFNDTKGTRYATSVYFLNPCATRRISLIVRSFMTEPTQ